LGGDAAPLFETPDAPIPPDGGAEWFLGAGSARLRAAIFRPEGESRGSVVVSPGRTEPIEKYFEVVRILANRRFTVLIHDWRGQGLSVRMTPDGRGDARGWEPFIEDYAALLAAFEARLPRPWIAFGHSMGGCLALLALARGERRFAGAMLSAPMLGLRTGAIPPALARGTARGLTALGLGSGLAVAEGGDAPFESNILTHDPARYRRNLDQVLAWPQLRVGAPTWGWLDFAFRATAELERGVGTTAIRTPLTVAIAGEEQLVDNDASARVAARIADARLVTIDGAFHEITQETDAVQAPFWVEFDALAARAGVA
jgi:lysophospholipase